MTVKFVVIVVVLIIVVGIGYYFRGLLVAATVNGKPVWRFAVVRTLEKQGGKQVLGTLVTKMLIEDEARAKGITIPESDIDAVVKKTEDGFKVQGGTLDAALKQNGLTLAEYRDQVRVQKELEKLMGDKVKVSDDDVAKYIKDNKLTVKAGDATSTQAIKDQIANQKMNTEIPPFLDGLKTKAKISYFVDYMPQ
jgi:foldase protein PrsA